MENTYEEKATQLASDLNEEIKGTELTTRTGASAIVKQVVSASATDVDFCITVLVADQEKTYYLDRAISAGFLVAPDEFKTLLTDYLLLYRNIKEKHDAELKAKKEEADRLAREAKELELAEIKHQAKLVKFEAMKAKQLEDIKDFKKVARKMLKNETFYTTIGWLAKHAGSTVAKLPDYMDSWFTNYFGKDVSKYVVDSSKRTTNGNPMIYTFGVVTSLVGVKEDSYIPAMIKESVSKKHFYNTEFMMTLVDDYGFKFAKTQDVDAIRNCIPAEHLVEFEQGYAN